MFIICQGTSACEFFLNRQNYPISRGGGIKKFKKYLKKFEVLQFFLILKKKHNAELQRADPGTKVTG